MTRTADRTVHIDTVRLDGQRVIITLSVKHDKYAVIHCVEVYPGFEQTFIYIGSQGHGFADDSASA